jgi:hypothetical protein
VLFFFEKNAIIQRHKGDYMAKKDISKKEETEIKKDIVKELKDKVMADLNKEIKSSIIDNTNKYKEELKSEITDTINTEVNYVLKREEKRIGRSKNFTIFKRDVLILLLLGVVGYFGYCLYDVKYFDFMKSDCEINGTCESTVTATEEVGEEVVKDTDWYIKNYGYLLDNVNTNLNADQVSAYYLYSADHKVNEIKSSYLLNLAYKQVPEKNIKTNTVNVTVSASDLKAAYQELFGTLDSYKDTNFTYDCLNFVYNKDKDKYVAENTECTTSNKQILESITEMYEEDNKMYIITSATIYDKNESSFYTFDNLYDPVLSNVTNKNFEENLKKLNKYQYIFKKADEVYYLDSITKLK